ncbi:MAG: MFS transporter, partial [Anaerolineales bacterium]|nr:MFS transporter [Anaerolineales bacterium]
VITGLFADMAGTARQAMLTDLLPEEKRADGFGMMRVAMNLSVAIGPAIGGFLAARSYMLLFSADAVSSIITAVLFYILVAETLPQVGRNTAEKDARPSFAESFRGYATVLKDRAFLLFMGTTMVVTIVYMQMYGTLPVFLRDVHNIPEAGFGMLMSLNATMVVLLQFAITRKIGRQPPMLMMALGALIYALGFVMYGFIDQYALFMLAMAIITIGEMVITPVSQSLVAKFSPEEMRGRYMAVFSIAWLVPGAVGPLLAGLLMDSGRPLWVWYASGILATVAALGFVLLNRNFERDDPSAPAHDVEPASTTIPKEFA